MLYYGLQWSSKECWSLQVYGCKLSADCQWPTLVLRLDSGVNAASVGLPVQALMLAVVGP